MVIAVGGAVKFSNNTGGDGIHLSWVQRRSGIWTDSGVMRGATGRTPIAAQSLSERGKKTARGAAAAGKRMITGVNYWTH